MKLIAHRINTITELKQLPSEYGVEVDLRDNGKKIILRHDPFGNGESFEKYLKAYQHGTLILNIKSERIEWDVLKLIKKHRIKNYFFLDSSFPMVIALTKEGIKNIALRFSEYEGIDTILSLKGKVQWIWVDCFNQLPINSKIYKKLKQAGFKLCLVSPELQGRAQDIPRYKEYLKRNKIIFDAICTKSHNIPLWE